jgi:Fur family ferric uptake transcriptional regulator
LTIDGILIIIIIMSHHRAEARKTLRTYINDKGLRHTRQREVILDAFLSAERHITVEELFDIVKRRNPEIGYATVDRNLKLMSACGLADEIKIGKQKTRYEQKIGQEHHDHLICVKCGKFIEVRDDRIEELQDRLAQANGFLPQRHKLEIYGLCRKCR